MACSKLNDTREQAEINTRKLDRLEKCQKENKEEILNLQNQRNQLQESVNTLERQLEERVNNLHPMINDNEIKIDRKVFWITTGFFVAVVGVLFQIHIDSVHKNLKEELNGVRSQLEERVNFVQKTLANEVHTLTWKITDFESVLEKAKTDKLQNILVHNPFYSHGYKLTLLINPNGSDNGKGTHLSLYVVIMKGKNDAMLPWPFLKKVEFRLVDQQEDPKERKNIVHSFTSPVKDHYIRHGFPTFVSHKSLKTRRYIVDDTLFIQIEVSSPDQD